MSSFKCIFVTSVTIAFLGIFNSTFVRCFFFFVEGKKNKDRYVDVREYQMGLFAGTTYKIKRFLLAKIVGGGFVEYNIVYFSQVLDIIIYV